MIQDGLLDIPGFDAEKFSFIGLASVFREIPIRIGRTVTFRCSRDVGRPGRAASWYRMGRAGTKAIEARLRATRCVQDLITRLLEICPTEPVAIWNSCAQLENSFRLRFGWKDLDNYSINALLEENREMEHWIDLAPGPVNINPHDWLASLPGRTKGLWKRSQPGCIHVAHVLSGGHSGRKHTFIVGLDDGRFVSPGLA